MIETLSVDARQSVQRTINPLDFDKMVQKLRGFFTQRNYKETFPQPRLSILAACEDPKTVRSFDFGGNIWPLPQTSQMHLDEEILKNASNVDGLYCLTASYRDEPNPIPDRHCLSFPMFEFEGKGNFEDLLNTLIELAIHLGFARDRKSIPIFTYDEMCMKYGVDTLESDHEMMMWGDYGDVVGITHFPVMTSPFFNMKESEIDGVFNKCDFIICGQETFGSAERSCDVDQMRNSFKTISDGLYAQLLFDKFGKDRVEKELNDYLSLPMISRFGAGIGLTRLKRAMKIKGII